MYPNQNKDMYKNKDLNAFEVKPSIKDDKFKRAFTIVPNKLNKIEGSVITAVDVEETISNTSNSNPSDWPSVDELEALIRGEQQENENYKPLELPLQFEEQISTSQPKTTNERNIDIHEPGIPFIEVPLEPTIAEYVQTDISQPSEVLNIKEDYYNGTRSWSKVMMATLSSVITGLLIGYILLLAVYGVNVWPVNMISSALTKETSAPTVEVNLPIAPVESTSSTEVVEAPAEKIVIQPMQSFSYTILQAGVFTKEDTKQALIEGLISKGYPHQTIVTEEQKAIVFAGLATNTQSAYQANVMSDIELYKKNIAIHVPKLSSNEETDATLQQWLYDTHDLIGSYIKMSEIQFEQQSYIAIYEESYGLLKEKYEAYLDNTEKLLLLLNEEASIELIEWHNAKLIELNNQFDSYQKQPSKKSLLIAQQHIIDIIAYQWKHFEN